MSGLEILIDRDGPLTRAAVLSDGILTDLYVDRVDRPSLLGAIFLGRVDRIVAGLDGAFVDLGGGRSGLLTGADVRGSQGRLRSKGERIGSVLRTGQSVLVQVKTEPSGAKAAALTMDITFPGRFLVHAPFGRDIAVSKRLGDGPARGELARRIGPLVSGGGWIVRAGAADAPDTLLAAESESLHLQWREIRDTAGTGTAPALLLPGPEAAIRALIERGGLSPARILIDDHALAADLTGWCADRAPDLHAVLSRHDRREGRLFERYDLDGAIERLLDRKVPLSAGGSLVIDPTEALTVIDVNAGERGNPLAANLEATGEIARQLRLRNVGGIVVIDFVNMRNRGDSERVLTALTRTVEDDPAQTHVYGMSKLGLVEMTRARRGTPLAALLRGPVQEGEG